MNHALHLLGVVQSASGRETEPRGEGFGIDVGEPSFLIFAPWIVEVILSDEVPQFGLRIGVKIHIFIPSPRKRNDASNGLGFHLIPRKHPPVIFVPPPVVWVIVSFQSCHDREDRDLLPTYDLVEQKPVGLCVLLDPSSHAIDKQADTFKLSDECVELS